MQINRRLTNGLAWAGLFVVVAIPVADAISGQLMGDRETVAAATVAEIEAPVPAPLSQRPDAPVARPSVQTAAVTPKTPVAAKPAAPNSPVVDSFLSSGKKLPSYITGGDDTPVAAAPTPPVAAKPAVVAAPAQVAVAPASPVVVPPKATVTPSLDPVEVASLPTDKIAPVPMPLSMRPKPVPQPLASQPVPEAIVLPPEEVVARNDGPLVVEDLEDWESGPLSEFLAKRQGPRSSATVNQPSSFDNNGFYLDEGPNGRRRGGYIGPVEDETYFQYDN